MVTYLAMNKTNKVAKNIIAVASGKGGVGKSTIALALALELAKKNYTVGLLDADIYGPSQPIILGVPENTKPQLVGVNTFLPIMLHGMQTMSIGYLLNSKESIYRDAYFPTILAK